MKGNQVFHIFKYYPISVFSFIFLLFLFVALFCFLAIKLTLLTDIMGTKYKGLGHLEQDSGHFNEKKLTTVLFFAAFLHKFQFLSDFWK